MKAETMASSLRREGSLLVLGTASGAGKTTVSLGIARSFARRGVSCAPFKAFNITDRICRLDDGKLMACAQASASVACGATPDSDMNPVALVAGDGECRMVVEGRATPMVEGREGIELWRNASHRAFCRISERFDVVVAEGSGSPVEMNVRDRDVANMNFAMREGVPAILVVDASRGGSFASAFGTLALLDEQERRLVRGVVVNRIEGTHRFRDEFMESMQNCLGVPVLGALPPVSVELSEEDGSKAWIEDSREFGLADYRGEAWGLPDELPIVRLKDPAWIRAQADVLADWIEAYMDMGRLEDIVFGRTDG